MRMLNIPIQKHVPDHQKPPFLHPPFEHVIEYERSKTRSLSDTSKHHFEHVIEYECSKPDPKTGARPSRSVHFWTKFSTRNSIRMLSNPIPKPIPNH